MFARQNTVIGRSLVVFFVVLLLAACSGSGNATDRSEGSAAAGTDAVAEKPAKPARVSQGQEIELADYAVAGQNVVFDFMSDYCPPCKQIAPYMDRLHEESSDVTVVKVDINRPGVRGIDWKSPVAAQFRLSSIPHFKVMDDKGNLLAEGDQAWEMVVGWLQELDAAQQNQGR
jgi:thiol-disulfide isomerase/thioredoxin